MNDPRVDDYGGGIFMGIGSSLSMSDSTITNNSADNYGGGIYFEGGAFHENPFVDYGLSKLHSTTLNIQSSYINANGITSEMGIGSGGGLFVNGPTAGMIADTEFAGNSAQQNGGAAYLTGIPAPRFDDPNGPPFAPYIGRINFVGCTFEGNSAALTVEGKPGDRGRGGAIDVDGVVNDVYIVESTFSGNKVVSGKGGAIFVAPSNVKFYFRIGFDVDYNSRLMDITSGQDVILPISPDTPVVKSGSTTLEIFNSTIAFNEANGTIFHNENTGEDTLFGARGGGLAVGVNDAGGLDGKVFVTSTIIAKNTISPSGIPLLGGYGPDLWAADDGAAGVVSLTGHGFNPISGLYDRGYNLVGISTGGTSGVNDAGCLALDTSVASGTLTKALDPKLYPLAYNGRRTKTHAIGWDSPAYEKGDNPLILQLDQRGETRIRAKLADIGAVEATGFAVEFPTITVYTSGTSTTTYTNQRSMITFLDVFMDPLAPGETLHVYHATYVASTNTYTPDIEVPINAPTITTEYYTPWAKNVTHVHITFQLSQFTYQLLAPSFFANSLNDGRYMVTVSEPAPLPPPGINHVVPGVGFWRLFGDVNGDATDAASDFIQFRLSLGGVEFSFDYDGDGSVSAADFIQFRLRFGGSI